MELIKPLFASWEKKVYKSVSLSWLYSLPYRHVIKNEIELAGITGQDVVLNVGCGAVPYTAIYLHYFTGARVWAVDRDRDAVEKARFYLKRLNLLHDVKPLHRDAADSIPADFTTALVALQAEPKASIMDNLLACGGMGKRLVFREAKKYAQNQYDLLPRQHEPVKHVKHEILAFNSVLFVQQS